MAYARSIHDHPNVYLEDALRRGAGGFRFNALEQLYSDFREEDQGCGRPAPQPRRRCPNACHAPPAPRPGFGQAQPPALRMQVRFVRKPVVAGAVDSPAILRELELRRGSLERCLGEAADSEHLTPGQLTVRIGIGPDGVATFARRQSGGLSDAHAEARMLDALRGLSLRTSPGAPFAISLALAVSDEG